MSVSFSGRSAFAGCCAIACRPPNRVSTVGALLLGLGMVLSLWALAASLWRGRRAPANPWGGASLEWATSSPPPHDNFGEPPASRHPYDYSGLRKIRGGTKAAPRTCSPPPSCSGRRRRCSP